MHETPPRLTRWDSLETRFWAFVDKTDTCWLWTGSLTKKGYARRIGHDGRFWSGHQLAYILLVGEIPPDLVIDHLCRVRHCVNPDHMELVTPEENTRRGTAARWLEDCPNGHPPALYRRTLPSGKNICVQCRRDGDKRRHERQRKQRNAKTRANYYARKRGAA